MVDSALPCRRVYGFLDEAWLARFSTCLLLCTHARRCKCQLTAASLTLPQRHGGAGHGLALILVDSVDFVDRSWSAENLCPAAVGKEKTKRGRPTEVVRRDQDQPQSRTKPAALLRRASTRTLDQAQ